MLDDRVRAVLARLEEEDARERADGLPSDLRGRQVARTTGQFLFALVAPQTDCEVLEIGGSRGYSTVWLASGVRYLGGRVLSLENDPAKIDAWRRNIADAGLEQWAELVPGERFVMRTAEGPFPMETTYTWRDGAAGVTEMTLRNRGEPAGFAKVGAPMMARAMRRANRKDLELLKRIWEGRS